MERNSAAYWDEILGQGKVIYGVATDDMHPARIVRADGGELTRAELELNRGWVGPYSYIRVTVIDQAGKYAWRNPIFLD